MSAYRDGKDPEVHELTLLADDLNQRVGKLEEGFEVVKTKGGKKGVLQGLKEEKKHEVFLHLFWIFGLVLVSLIVATSVSAVHIVGMIYGQPEVIECSGGSDE